MLTMSSLMKRRVLAGDRRYPVTEIFFHEKTGHLRYVALHTGGAFDHDEALIAIGRFEPTEEGEREWSVTLDEEEIRGAPIWDSGEAYPHHVPVSLESWPPIIVGPFGGTTSPLLFYAAMIEAEDSVEPEEPPHHITDRRVERLERAGKRLGGEVFGADGQLGRLDDLAVDHIGFTITDFVIDERRLPYARLRHMADEGAHTVVNIDKAEFEALPRAGA